MEQLNNRKGNKIMDFINELKIKYMICFVDHNRLQAKETGKGILTATFQNSATYDTKLEALDHLRLYGSDGCNYTIIEIIEVNDN